mmetsp:Transcript_13594/g.26964  ORF Transcript_13594/g.26964 Transcript_13594/m.26964 type:complete len:236 (-) Transcript_13594:182-889(-)
MQTLVATDQLVGERQTGHQTSLLQPVDCTERPREEDALNGTEGDQTLCKRVAVVHPLHGPLSLLLHCRHCGDGREESVLLLCVLDVLVDQQAVHFRVDVLHGDLESVEGPGLRHLDLLKEPGRQVLQHDAVGSREESQHVLDKVLLALVECLPVLGVLGEVQFLCRPEGRLLLLVHIPDFLVLSGDHVMSLLRFVQNGLALLELLELRADLAHRGILLMRGHSGRLFVRQRIGDC